MRKFLLVVAAALLAMPAVAGAVSVEKSGRAAEDAPKVFGVGMSSVNAGLGYSNYTGDIAPEVAPGPGWDVRLDLDVSQPVDLEVQYLGAINSLTPENLDQFNLYTNEVQAAGKIQPVSIAKAEPYVAGGIGLTRVSVAKNPELNANVQSDTMGNVPLSAGVDYPINETFLVGARAQWDIYFDNELLVQQKTTHSDRWGFMVSLGAARF